MNSTPTSQTADILAFTNHQPRDALTISKPKGRLVYLNTFYHLLALKYFKLMTSERLIVTAAQIVFHFAIPVVFLGELSGHPKSRLSFTKCLSPSN